jgi:hypothetical protein
MELGPGLLIAGGGTLGAVIAVVIVIARMTLRDRRAGPLQAIAELDEVSQLKEQVQVHLQLEEDLIAAGQALGRVRRFMVDPEEAGPLVDELRERLADLWLRRFDLEGRLRLASLRRRLPSPPPVNALRDELTIDQIEEQSSVIEELSTRFREIAERAEDSARMFRRMAPGEDAHARWVSDSVEVAAEWRQAQGEEILRFAARIAAQSERLLELAESLSSASADALIHAGPGLETSELVVRIPGLRSRMIALARVGLDERNASELDATPEAHNSAQNALKEARMVVADVRAMARRAGATRSHRRPVEDTPPVEPAVPTEATTSA